MPVFNPTLPLYPCWLDAYSSKGCTCELQKELHKCKHERKWWEEKRTGDDNKERSGEGQARNDYKACTHDARAQKLRQQFRMYDKKVTATNGKAKGGQGR